MLSQIWVLCHVYQTVFFYHTSQTTLLAWARFSFKSTNDACQYMEKVLICKIIFITFNSGWIGKAIYKIQAYSHDNTTMVVKTWKYGSEDNLCSWYTILYPLSVVFPQYPLLLTWINFNPSMDMYSHPLWSVGWNYLSFHKLQRCTRWSLLIDKQFSTVPHFTRQVITYLCWD